MPPSAARVTPNLIKVLERLDDGSLSIAEINRRVGAAAEALGLQRPSYECVRILVHEQRLRNWRRGPTTGEVLTDIAFRVKPPTALLDHMAGIDVRGDPQPPRRPKRGK